jgi:hypothetical protein
MRGECLPCTSVSVKGVARPGRWKGWGHAISPAPICVKGEGSEAGPQLTCRDGVVSYVPLFGEGVGGHPNALSPCTQEGEWEGVGSTGVEGWKDTLSVHAKGGGTWAGRWKWPNPGGGGWGPPLCKQREGQGCAVG